MDSRARRVEIPFPPLSPFLLNSSRDFWLYSIPMLGLKLVYMEFGISVVLLVSNLSFLELPEEFKGMRVL